MNHNESIKIIVVLVAVSLLAALSLSIVYEKTKPVIEKNKLDELKKSLIEVMPNAKYFEENKDLTNLNNLISEREEGIKKIFNAYDAENNKTGVVLLIDSKGFGGVIKILVGVDANTKKISGVKILEHSETPGLGDKITEPLFLAQFKGRSITIKEEQIDGITGATISSKAVIDGIRESVEKIDIRIVYSKY